MPSILFVSVLALFLFLACSSAPDNQSSGEIQAELEKLNQVFRNRDFMIGVAKAQEAAYYHALGKTAPPFISAADSSGTITKNLHDERIAATLAPFYALECGVGAIIRKKQGSTPLTILKLVAAWRIDSTSKFLLTCFANATWKAGQAFMGLGNLQNSNSRSAGLLTDTERNMYVEQLRLIAKIMVTDLEGVAGGTCQMQLEKIRSFMQDSAYTLRMAEQIDASSITTETTSVERSKYEEKIATNLPGLLALESGITFLAKTKGQLPSVLIRSINENTIGEEDMMLLSRFANATWKASQPFRGRGRIKGSTFIPFNQLSDEEVEKDRVQIRAAAAFVTQNVFSETQKRY